MDHTWWDIRWRKAYSILWHLPWGLPPWDPFISKASSKQWKIHYERWRVSALLAVEEGKGNHVADLTCTLEEFLVSVTDWLPQMQRWSWGKCAWPLWPGLRGKWYKSSSNAASGIGEKLNSNWAGSNQSLLWPPAFTSKEKLKSFFKRGFKFIMLWLW